MSKIKKYLAALLTLALMASACAAGISMTVSAAPGDYPSADEIYEDVNTLKEVYSPNGELFMSFWLSSAGEAYYEVVYNGIRVVENSKLGLRLDYGTLDSGFELLSTATAANNTSWNDPLNQMAVIPDKYNELTVSLRSGDTDVNMIFCAYNDGAALKYSF
ncbi:MAG TPA: hypothetical protein DEQ02_03505, partial [Ruminococcaceae bacterium]|nr:hypothetical protein [Oscillospiraceae bacterium]